MITTTGREPGCPGWAWHDVEPYFRRAEGYEDDGHESLGRDGPYAVSRIRSLHPLTLRFVEACAEIGLPTLDDYNRGDREGAFVNLTSQSRGRRSSTGNRYLPTRARGANLRILADTIVDRVTFEGRRAVGVRAQADGSAIEIRARRQVVLSAGTVQSPAILLRSGIGPPPQLQAHGIPVVVDSAQVGRNLQEHCGLTISRFVNVPTYNSESSGVHAARHLLNYLAFRRGPLASAAVQGMGWARTEPVAAGAGHPSQLAAVRHRLHRDAARHAREAGREPRHLRFAAARARLDPTALQVNRRQAGDRLPPCRRTPGTSPRSSGASG